MERGDPEMADSYPCGRLFRWRLGSHVACVNSFQQNTYLAASRIRRWPRSSQMVSGKPLH